MFLTSHRPRHRQSRFLEGSMRKSTNGPVYHSNPFQVVVECLGTTSKTDNTILKDSYKEPICAQYDFNTNQFNFDLVQNGFKEIQMISHVLSWKNVEINLKRIADLLMAVLHDRHPFDTSLHLDLKYTMPESGTKTVFHSRYEFQVTKQKFSHVNSRCWMFVTISFRFLTSVLPLSWLSRSWITSSQTRRRQIFSTNSLWESHSWWELKRKFL